MALTVEALMTARDALVLALASGARRVRDQNGEEIEYRSVGEMKGALAHLESRIAAMQGATVNHINWKVSKGT